MKSGKPRSDSKLAKLSRSQRQQLMAWLRDHSYRRVVALIADQMGMKTNTWSVGVFYKENEAEIRGNGPLAPASVADVFFTLAQIACAADLDGNRMAAHLARTVADGRVKTWPGRVQRGWKLGSLPTTVRRRLKEKARLHGVSVIRLLSDPPALHLPAFVCGEDVLRCTLNSISWLRGPCTPTREEREFVWECICRELHRLSTFDVCSHNGHALDDLCRELGNTDFSYYMAPEVIRRVLPRKYARWRRRTGTDYLPLKKQYRPEPPATGWPVNLDGEELH